MCRPWLRRSGRKSRRRSRLSRAQRALIEAARTDAILEDFRGLCAAAPAIELESPRTVAGMNYLVALNILTPERRDAILDPNL